MRCYFCGKQAQAGYINNLGDTIFVCREHYDVKEKQSMLKRLMMR